MQISEIHGEYIKLNQWLKKENLIGTGGETRGLVEAGLVRVNGQQVTELRKKLHDGDVVEVDGEDSYRIQVVS